MQTEKATTTKKRGRPSAGTASNAKRRKNGAAAADAEDSDAPASLQAKQFKPPAGSWEDHVDIVDMYRDEDGALMVYLTWKSGDKTQHAARQAYQRCPQKVRTPILDLPSGMKCCSEASTPPQILQFYESKINFKTE